MELLDKRGRLFGKINIVDFLIVGLIIVIIPTFFYVYKVLGKKVQAVPVYWVRAEVVTLPVFAVAEIFREGDLSYDEQGSPDARLVRLIKKDAGYGEKIKAAALRKSTDETFDYKVPVFMELELACTRGSKRDPWYYRRQPLLIGTGSMIFFNTDRYSVPCYVLKVNDEGIKRDDKR
ncbi:MAG: DUF4330 family protein [Candidatus Omnitrophota bacterium]